MHLQRTFEASPGVQARSFRTTCSGASGYFWFRNLGPGSGTLTIMASGYTTKLADVPPADDVDVNIVRLDPIRIDAGGKTR